MLGKLVDSLKSTKENDVVWKVGGLEVSESIPLIYWGGIFEPSPNDKYLLEPDYWIYRQSLIDGTLQATKL